MNDMNPSGDYRDDYRDDYRRNYRGNYRGDYRDDYRDDYRGNYRRDYDRRGGRRNYRNYREEDYLEELENCVDEGMYRYRKYEDLAEMAENPQEKSMIMKIAEREKEHYKTLKEMLEKHM